VCDPPVFLRCVTPGSLAHSAGGEAAAFGGGEDELVALSNGPVFLPPDGKGALAAEEAAAFVVALARLGSVARVLRPLTEGEEDGEHETRFHAERFLEAMGVTHASPPLAVAWLVVQVRPPPRHTRQEFMNLLGPQAGSFSFAVVPWNPLDECALATESRSSPQSPVRWTQLREEGGESFRLDDWCVGRRSTGVGNR
jgi:hypothetical protein